jgi:hypothetical protein
MKKLLIIVVIISFLSCNDDKPIKKYKLIIEKDSGIKEDSLIAYDDSSAYSKALISFKASKMADSLTAYRFGKTKSFRIVDASGNDLLVKLPKQVIERMTTYISNLRTNDPANNKGNNNGKSKVICPIKVLKSKIIEDEYGSKSISVSVKNISRKTIDAVSLSWILRNNFGDMVNDHDENGISQHKLKPGKSGSYEWDLYRTTATKCAVFITKVHFTDDSKWQLVNE